MQKKHSSDHHSNQSPSEKISLIVLAIATILLITFLISPDHIDRPLYQGITEGWVIDVVKTTNLDKKNNRVIIVHLDSGNVYSTPSKYKKVGDRVYFATYTRLFSRQTTYQIFLKNE